MAEEYWHLSSLAVLLSSDSAGHIFEGVRGLPAILATRTGAVPTAACQRGGEPPRQPQPSSSSTIPPYTKMVTKGKEKKKIPQYVLT